MRLMTLIVALSIALFSLTSVAAPQGDYRPYTPTSAAEQVDAPLYVVIAYSAIWLLVLLFVASVWLRQRRVEAELTQVRQRLERRDEPS